MGKMPGSAPLCAALRAGSIHGIAAAVLQYHNTHAKSGQQNPALWTAELRDLQAELAYDGYDGVTYLGQPGILYISKLGSNAWLVFDIKRMSELDADEDIDSCIKAVSFHANHTRFELAPDVVLATWRSQSGTTTNLVVNICSMLNASNGRIARRLGGTGLDKHKLITAFQNGVFNGVLAANGVTTSGLAAVDTLVSEVNALNLKTKSHYKLLLEPVGRNGKYQAIVMRDEEECIRFNMNLEAAIAASYRGESARKTALVRATGKGQLAEDSMRTTSNLLPSLDISASDIMSGRDLERKHRDAKYSGEVIAGGITFGEMKEMLQSEEGRAEVKRLLEHALALPEGSRLSDMLSIARGQVADVDASPAMLALLLALI